MSSYLKNAMKVLQLIEQYEEASMKKAAQLIYQSLVNGGIVQLFGSGHSQLLAQDAYYRAGGLVAIKPISIEDLMLHKGALLSSANEKDISRMPEYWSQIDLQKNDTLIVISTSGRNAVPVEIALRAKEMGIPVITVQSLDYVRQTAKHPSGKRLEDFATVVLNTHVPVGDGVMKLQSAQFGPVSTIAGAALLNEVTAQAIQLLDETISPLPVFGSNNVDTAGNSNEYLMNQYKDRINFN